MRGPSSINVKLSLKFFEVSGTWEPNDVERRAAWDLYVELVTRVAVVPLRGNEGFLREALNSFYSIFSTTREVLKKYGPEVAEPKKNGQYNFAFLAIALLNYELRPLLTRWHPLLEDWEDARSSHIARHEHEGAWDLAPELRADLHRMRTNIVAYSVLLGTACGVPDLSAAVPEE